jgi:diguanylate cyclase (GGDEF)-like protein
MSVRVKIILSFVALITISLLVSGILSIEKGETIVSDIVKKDNIQVATLISEELKRVLQEAISAIKLTAGIKEVWSFNKEGMDVNIKRLLGYKENNNFIKKVAVFDTKGNLMYGTEDIPQKQYLKMWYAGLVLGSVEGFFSSFYLQKEYNSEYPAYFYVTLIRDDLFKIRGVMVVELDFSYINSLLANLSFDKEIKIYITNGAGQIVSESSSEQYKIGEKVPFYMPSVQNTRIYKYSLSLKKNYLVVKKYISSPVDLNIFVLRDLGQVLLPVYNLKNSFIILILLCIFTAIIIGIGIAFTITLPLNYLMKKVDLLAKGHLDTKIESMSDDEIGVLATHFDSMRESLKEKIYELSLLNKISQDLTSELDYERVLKLILDKVIEVMVADRASIMIVDEDTGKLVIQVAKGLDEEIIHSTEVSIGSGIVGKVVETGEAYYVADASESQLLKTIKAEDEIEKGTFLSVPLKVKGQVKGVVNVFKDVPNFFSSRQIELFYRLVNSAAIAYENARLYKLAITDGLTKLYIHRYFQTRLSEEIKRSHRYNTSVSLIMTDIDHFKNFNDTYGHQIGDEVLKIVARVIKRQVRDVDIVARYGGEEFAVICPEKNAEEIRIAAERMRKAVASYDFRVKGEKVRITISLGVSDFPGDATEKNDLIEKADKALYHAKESGRNRVVLYSELKHEVIKN